MNMPRVDHLAVLIFGVAVIAGTVPAKAEGQYRRFPKPKARRAASVAGPAAIATTTPEAENATNHPAFQQPVRAESG